MTKDMACTELKQIFADILECETDDIIVSLSPDNCETWDSLAQVKIVIAIEEEFDIVITPEEQFDFENYGHFEERVLADVK